MAKPTSVNNSKHLINQSETGSALLAHAQEAKKVTFSIPLTIPLKPQISEKKKDVHKM